jgi:hypothetical protein
VTPERRCPTCDALVSAEAEWCGQCFAQLPPSEPAHPAGPGPQDRSQRDLAEPTAVAVARGLEVQEGRPAWTCPVCEGTNPIEAAVCATCGTPFARLFAEQQERPGVEPQSAAVWSMALPGLGHWRLGLRADGVARMVMFGWSFGALLVLLVSRFGKGGLGPTMPLFVLFLGSSAAIYAVSAIDAYRIASGDPPLVSSRTLLWASAGLVVLSVLVASLVTLPAARR